jgi:hypothetical protein
MFYGGGEDESKEKREAKTKKTGRISMDERQSSRELLEMERLHGKQ